MSRSNTGFLKTVLPVFTALLVFSACSEMEDGNSPQLPTQQQRVLELDPGESVPNTVTISMNKAFSAQSLSPLTGLRIAYDMSHNSGRQAATSPTGGNGNSIMFGDYIARGATISVITTFDLATLNNYDVLWLEEDFSNALTATEQTVLATWVTNGGSVVVLAEDWVGGSPLTPLGYAYFNAFASGITSNIAVHPLTDGVSSLRFEATGRGLTEPAGATWIAKNMSDNGPFISVRTLGAGKVVVLSDEFFFNSIVDLEDNRLLGNNMMTWLFTRTVDIDIKPGTYPNSINCSGNGNVLVTVAILSTSSFNALDVDHTTVRFEGAAEKHSHQGNMTRHEQDVDNDGDMDLVFHFPFNQTTLECNSTAATLSGKTSSGQSFSGSDSVHMVP